MKKYLYETYQRTKWNMFGLRELEIMFGKENARKQLNQLYKEGLIEKKQGCNYPLVKYLGD